MSHQHPQRIPWPENNCADEKTLRQALFLSSRRDKNSTFAASTSVLPSVRVALPATVHTPGLDKVTRDLEVCESNQYLTLTLSFHLFCADCSSQRLLDSSLSSLQVASDLQQERVSRITFSRCLGQTGVSRRLPCLARSLSL